MQLTYDDAYSISNMTSTLWSAFFEEKKVGGGI